MATTAALHRALCSRDGRGRVQSGGIVQSGGRVQSGMSSKFGRGIYGGNEVIEERGRGGVWKTVVSRKQKAAASLYSIFSQSISAQNHPLLPVRGTFLAAIYQHQSAAQI